MSVLELLSRQRPLTSEVTAMPTQGHAPGTMSLAIVSRGQRAFILAHVLHSPAQVTEADWYFAFELDPPQANRTRQEFFDRLERE